MCKRSGEGFRDAGSDICRDTLFSSRCSLGGLGGGARDGDVEGDWVVDGAVETSVVARDVEVRGAVAVGAGRVSACTLPMIGSDKAFFNSGEFSQAGG